MATESVFGPQLRERRARLERAQQGGARPPEVARLLAEVDAALERLEHGSFGLCETCHDPIEPERLAADPLLRFCLDHLSPAQQADLQRDLELAGRIQTALLPQRETVLPGWDVHYVYRPAGAVSGDTCDVWPEGQGGFQLLLGDVAGKGVAASLLMANLQAAFRALALSELPLGERVARANHLFCEATLPSSYATLVAARGRAGGEIELVNAGHCPPLLLRAGRVEALPASGLPLGLFCSASYEPARLQLGRGDLLLLYTDGLSEARSAAGEELGVEPIERLLAGLPQGLPAREVVAAVEQTLLRFTGGTVGQDDLTVLALRRA